MPDRKARPDKRTAGKPNPKRADQPSPHDHPDLGQQANPESQESTTARPRGHTEEPDRTL
jgi:hypothetical protein